MALCKECGCSNPDTGLYCWKCGSKLEQDAPLFPPEPAGEQADIGFSAEPEPAIVEEAPAEPVTEGMPLEAAPAEHIVEEAPAEPIAAAPRTDALAEQPGTARRSIDLGPSGGSEEPAGEPSPRRTRKPKAERVKEPRPERSAPAGFLGDPFNAKITVLMCGILSIMVACYAVFGYKATFTLDGEGIGALSIHTLASFGAAGIFPSDGMSICIAITMVITVLGAIRAIPIMGGLAGIVTTALYYNAKFSIFGDVFGTTKLTMSTESLAVLIALWVVIIIMSVLQTIALKSYSATCEDEPYPLIKIWFGRL